MIKDLPYGFVAALKIDKRLVHGGQSHSKTLAELIAAGGISLEEMYFHTKRCGRFSEALFPDKPDADGMRHALRQAVTEWQRRVAAGS